MPFLVIQDQPQESLIRLSGLVKHLFLLLLLATEDVKDEISEIQLEKCDGKRLENSSVLKNLSFKLKHMEIENKEELIGVTTSFENLFQDTPTRTNAIVHDMQVENVEPIKQHPYRVHPK